MKKKLLSLTLALMLCLSIAAPAFAFGPPIDVYILESEQSSVTAKAGETGILQAENVLDDTKPLKWTSSDSTGLSVDSVTTVGVTTTAHYTAHRAGVYTMTATQVDGSGIPASITVTVTGTAKTPTKTPPTTSANNAVPSPTKLVVDGVPVAADAYLISENNYVKLRDLAMMVNNTGKNFNVTWDGPKDAINLTSTTVYVPDGKELILGDGTGKMATLTTSKIYVDGVETALTAYLIGENNYFKLRDVMSTFDIYVGYDNATGTATLDTTKSYVAP